MTPSGLPFRFGDILLGIRVTHSFLYSAQVKGFVTQRHIRQKRSLSWEVDGGHRWRQHERDSKIHKKNVYVMKRGEAKKKTHRIVSAQTLEVSLFGVGTVLRLERDGCVVNDQRMSTPASPIRRSLSYVPTGMPYGR